MSIHQPPEERPGLVNDAHWSIAGRTLIHASCLRAERRASAGTKSTNAAKAVVLFETSIQGRRTARRERRPERPGRSGPQRAPFDESGLISDLTVFFRPLGSLGLTAEVIGARLAERFGPPPE